MTKSRLRKHVWICAGVVALVTRASFCGAFQPSVFTFEEGLNTELLGMVSSERGKDDGPRILLGTESFLDGGTTVMTLVLGKHGQLKVAVTAHIKGYDSSAAKQPEEAGFRPAKNHEEILPQVLVTPFDLLSFHLVVKDKSPLADLLLRYLEKASMPDDPNVSRLVYRVRTLLPQSARAAKLPVPPLLIRKHDLLK